MIELKETLHCSEREPLRPIWGGSARQIDARGLTGARVCVPCISARNTCVVAVQKFAWSRIGEGFSSVVRPPANRETSRSVWPHLNRRMR